VCIPTCEELQKIMYKDLWQSALGPCFAVLAVVRTAIHDCKPAVT